MKKLTFVVGLLLAIFTLSMLVHGADAARKKAREGRLQHVVTFKFKEGTTPEQIREVENAFRALKRKIPQIAGFEYGTNCSPEVLNKGFTHCFVLTFKSDKDRDDYLPHPDHQAFGKLVGPVLDDVFVIDFFSGD